MPDHSPGPSGSTPEERRSAAAARRLPQHVKILLGLVLGATLGIAAHMACSRPVSHANVLDVDANGLDDRLDWLVGNVVEPIGRVFLRLVLMIVVPLVVSALALAVVELGDLQ